MHLDIAQEPPDARIHAKNFTSQHRAADFVRACAVEMQQREDWTLDVEIYV
jgi:hypothetical protein